MMLQKSRLVALLLTASIMGGSSPLLGWAEAVDGQEIASKEVAEAVKDEMKETPKAEEDLRPVRYPYQEQLAQFIKSYNKRLTGEQARVMAEAIMEFSHKYQVDFRIVTGVIAVESAFRSDAVSSSGAIGLGQLKPATAKWLGVVNPYDPIDNIAGASRYLGWLLQKYNGSLDHALSAYYQGQGTVDRQGITPTMTTYLLKVNNVLKPMGAFFH